ncbi:lactonase family protein [Maribacter sp. CXY002]|uniref:lactonase family protein n=1 Tax=Maribacter luteocoastalis TaxID=3407671 RepID=UPI003B6783B7
MKYTFPVFALFLSLFLLGCKMTQDNQNYTLYVGTYTEGDSEGIYEYQFNPKTGAMKSKILAAPLNNPSFIKLSPDKKYLYSVMETDEFEGSTGGVMAYRINEKGGLIEIGPKASVGAHPCHIAISDDGKFLAAASYTGGSASIFKLNIDGALQQDPQFIDLKVLDTIKTSHAHSAAFTEDGLFIADLGLDAVKRYKNKEGQFVPNVQATINLPDGAGPRHFTFNNKGNQLFVINELNSTITSFKREGSGTYTVMQTVNTLDENFAGDSYCADIHLSEDGKFLYGSNRGENTIVIFKVDENSGKLTLVGRESVHGDWPRNFALDPSGNFLLVANQKSNNIVVFKRDSEDGTLRFLHEIELPSPVCLEFLEIL